MTSTQIFNSCLSEIETFKDKRVSYISGNNSLVVTRILPERILAHRDGSDFSIPIARLKEACSALSKGPAVEMNEVFSGSGNFRSGLESLLAHCSNIGYLSANSEFNEGPKRIIWSDEKLHESGELHEISRDQFSKIKNQNETCDKSDNKELISLLAKPFLIFTGLSGSGKTREALKLAHYYGHAGQRRLIVPVGPDWHNRDPLLGYPDGLDPHRYLSQPTLLLILQASQTPDLPHFLILDEMNLSHVERYFSDFLSAMESGKGGNIHLYEGPNRFLDPGDESTLIPQSFTLPDNLFIIGTVNVDETTYQFSPKVLDRANVIEFTMKPADIDHFFDHTIPATFPEGSPEEARDFLKRAQVEDSVAIDWFGNDPEDPLRAEMKALFEIMHPFNSEFGYRTLKEATRYAYFSMENPEQEITQKEFETAMDAIIIQKLLPKLHGSRSKLEGLLRSLLHFCSVSGDDRSDLEKLRTTALGKADDRSQSLEQLASDKDKHYPRSCLKLRKMCKKLSQDQFVSFTEA